jgi:hypothetical protein
MSGVFACGEPPRVLQGTVTGYDSSSKILTVKDELGQHQERLFSLKEAELGAEPVAGDAVRLSYYDKDGQLVATRLMNLTRQQEIGKLSKDKEKQ